MICPECSKNHTLPGFTWCRWCIDSLAADYHARAEVRRAEEERQEELAACSALTQWLQLSQRAQPGRCYICGAWAQRSARPAVFPYCPLESDDLNSEWTFCASPGCYRWAAGTHHCAHHGGTDYTPRSTR